jgi:hypothetical protein
MRLTMRRKTNRVGKRAHRPKLRLGLLDLDQAKAGVLNSLRTPESQRGYRLSIDEFIAWYPDRGEQQFGGALE